MLGKVNNGLNNLNTALTELETVLGKLKARGVVDHATKFKDEVLPIAESIRDAVDFLERYVADDYWPLPVYREMLFVK